jgi:hypothetical protein
VTWEVHEEVATGLHPLRVWPVRRIDGKLVQWKPGVWQHKSRRFESIKTLLRQIWNEEYTLLVDFDGSERCDVASSWNGSIRNKHFTKHVRTS